MDALLIKQSNPFRVLKAFFIKVSVCFKLFKSALNKYASAPSSSNSFFNFKALLLDLLKWIAIFVSKLTKL